MFIKDFMNYRKNNALANELENKINALNDEMENLKIEHEELANENEKAKNHLRELLRVCDGWEEIEELGIEPEFSPLSTDQLELKIFSCEQRLANMVAKDSQNSAIIYTRDYRVDGSLAKGRKFQETYGKNLIRAFNAYCASKNKSVTLHNFNKNEDTVRNMFDRLNKQGDILGIYINKDYRDESIKMMEYYASLKASKQMEREKLKEEKRRLKEEEKFLEEAERAKKKLIEERKQFECALAKSISEEEANKIREKIAEIDKREADIDYRITQQKAGWLYIITNRSLEGICKIGCSRRLNPFERIKELSSASLPYNYVCKGLVFSEDIFALESAIHNYFDDKRVNKENKHKEHFYVSPEEVIDVLTNNFGCEVKFMNEEEFDN